MTPAVKVSQLSEIDFLTYLHISSEWSRQDIFTDNNIYSVPENISDTLVTPIRTEYCGIYCGTTYR